MRLYLTPGLRITLTFAALIIFFSPVTGQKILPVPPVRLSETETISLLKGDVIVRDLTETNDSGKTLEVIALIDASVAEVYRVLTAFEEYPEFIPYLTRIDVLEKTSETAILNYTQELPLKQVKKFRLRMHYDINSSQAMLKWTLIEWPGLSPGETIANSTGYWQIEPYPGTDTVLALYHVFTDPGPIPTGLEWIVNILTVYTAPKIVANTRMRVETHSSGSLNN